MKMDIMLPASGNASGQMMGSFIAIHSKWDCRQELCHLLTGSIGDLQSDGTRVPRLLGIIGP